PPPTALAAAEPSSRPGRGDRRRPHLIQQRCYNFAHGSRTARSRAGHAAAARPRAARRRRRADLRRPWPERLPAALQPGGAGARPARPELDPRPGPHDRRDPLRGQPDGGADEQVRPGRAGAGRRRATADRPPDRARSLLPVTDAEWAATGAAVEE